MQTGSLRGAGLGLRRTFQGPLADCEQSPPDFIEVAPENWINVGGRLGRQFRRCTERYPLVFHGLSLDLGGFRPVDEALVRSVGELMREHDALIYTEHLSYCADEGHLYDLMPIPFTEEAIHHTAGRVRAVQDILGQRIALENVSYYAAPDQEMTELEFIRAVLDEADCGLLLDVNNIYVNSINHRYDAEEFLFGLPRERVVYIHIAGHYVEAEDLRVDTHGADVIDRVWHLLDLTYQHFGNLPTLLERDFNIPPLNVLLREVDRVRDAQSRATESATATQQRLIGERVG